MTTHVQDWSAYEVAEEPEVTFDPEKAVPAVLAADIAKRESLFAEYRRLAALLVPKDDASIERIGVLVEFCKKGARAIEAVRKAELNPSLTEIDRINCKYTPPRDLFLLIAKGKTEEVNRFLEEQKRAAYLKQQEVLAEAARQQALLDKQAQEAKNKAAQAAERGDLVAAAVQEGKASILEQKAAEIVPMQVAMPNGKVELETSTVSFGGVKKVWALPGWDKESKLYADSSILGDVDMNWLRRFCVVDTVRLNAAFKSGEVFPKPFIVTNDYSKSRVR